MPTGLRLDFVDIRILTPSDIELLAKANQDVFDNPVVAATADAFLRDERHHICAAIYNDEIVGMATGVNYIHPDKKEEFWINEVGVAAKFQKKGLGKLILQFLLKHGSSLGCAEAWVLTSDDNVAARSLYRAVGGIEQEKAVYVTFDLGASK